MDGATSPANEPEPHPTIGRDVVVDGFRLHLEESGAGEPTLVLLHGFASSSSSWQLVRPALSSTHRVIAIDRLGFGRSERPRRGSWDGASPYATTAAVTHTLAVLDACCPPPSRVVLVGHSAGGAIAVGAAIEDQDGAPGRVAGLVLVSPAIFGDGPPPLVRSMMHVPGMGAAMSFSLRHAGPRLIERGLRRAWHAPSAMPAAIRAAYHDLADADGFADALVEMTRAVVPLDLAGRLGAIDLPALVITGDDDRIVPVADSTRVARSLPDAELVVVPECGHVAHEERPAAVVEAVTRFVARLVTG